MEKVRLSEAPAANVNPAMGEQPAGLDGVRVVEAECIVDRPSGRRIVPALGYDHRGVDPFELLLELFRRDRGEVFAFILGLLCFDHLLDFFYVLFYLSCGPLL